MNDGNGLHNIAFHSLVWQEVGHFGGEDQWTRGVGRAEECCFCDKTPTQTRTTDYYEVLKIQKLLINVNTSHACNDALPQAYGDSQMSYFGGAPGNILIKRDIR